MTQYEALMLHDRPVADRWHVSPDIEDVAGWWPDGTPAVLIDPEDNAGRRYVLDVIPKRRSVDDDSLEDHPAVERLIDTAIALNQILRPWPGTPLADAWVAGSPQAAAAAVNGYLRQQLGPDALEPVLHLAQRITAARPDSHPVDPSRRRRIEDPDEYRRGRRDGDETKEQK